MEDQKSAVAIIGMSLMLPDANNQDEFYENLKSGRDSLTGPSLERLIYSGIVPGKEYKPGAYVGRIDQFDHKFFKISKREAECMDPSQRILLQLACCSIENAGYAIDDFRNTETAVYLCSNNIFTMLYQMKLEAVNSDPDPAIHTGTLNSMIAGRISYCLGLTGPSLMIDCGCSSSVVALNEAVDKLISGSINTALVGGLVLKPSAQEVGSEGHLGAASRSGKSRAFDAEADGIGIGEGGAVVLIKRLEDAIRDNDNIQAVIKGIGITQDGGRCNSIAAPSPIAQTSAVKKAWSRSNIDPGSITYIETHGAGTHLGDVIEIQALTDAFGAQYAGKKICALGAVKTNIGHIGNAAGIAGIVKAVISLKKKELFPCLHFKTPNPFIDFDNSAVYVNTELKKWEVNDEHPLRCGISSFGLSGTNGHVVLEEFIKQQSNATKSGDNKNGVFLKIAAKSANAWSNYRSNIVDYLASTENRLEDVLFTLNTGRSDYGCRQGFYEENLDQLLQKITEFDKPPSNIFTNSQDKQIVLLFSSGNYLQSFVTALYKNGKFFRSTFDEIKNSFKTFEKGSAAEIFAVQMALYSEIEQSGISIKTVIGNGIGTLVTRVISGRLSVREAINLIEIEEICEAPINEEKLKGLLSTLLTDTCKTFVELGANNNIYNFLTTIQTELNDMDLVPLPNCETANPILSLFTDLYNKGILVNWKKYFNDQNLLKVEAPTYPFEKTRCWYAEPIDPVKSSISNSLFKQTWQPNVKTGNRETLSDKIFLLFTTDKQLGENVVDQLGMNDNRCIEVKLSDQFLKHSADCYELDCRNEDDYIRLRENLLNDQIKIDGIIHLGAFAKAQELSVENHKNALDISFIAQYLTAKTFSESLSKNGFYYSVLTSFATKVTAADSHISPLHAMCTVLLKSLMVEYPGIQATSLDLSYTEYSKTKAVESLISEMSHDGQLRFVAIRDSERFTPVLESVQIEGVDPSTVFETVNAVYLVTGGASGIGLETCKAIADTGPAHFVITGRTALPPQEKWEEILNASVKIENYNRIEGMDLLRKKGSVVEYHSVDVGDEDAMRAMFDEIGKRISGLTGIIHAAGLGNTGIAIKQKEVEGMLATLRPKVTGTLLLETLSRQLSPGFFLSFSSIAVLVPSGGSSDYSSANAFEDAFAESMRLAGSRFITINWSDWIETGLAYRKRLLRSVEEVEARDKLVKGLTNKEGMLAILFALSLDLPQLAVVNTNLKSFAANPFFSINEMKESSALEPDETGKHIENGQHHNSLVNTKGDFSEVEFKLAMIWHEILKLDSIRPDDDFYQLGGHSLNITQMLNKIKKVFGVAFEMDELINNNSVRLLARRIEECIEIGNIEEYKTIEPLADKPYYEISHAQKRFWIVSQLPGSEAYNVPAAYVFIGQLNIGALEKAFRTIVERHESLRTGFLLVDGIPMQKVFPMNAFQFELSCIDSKHLANKPKEMQNILQKEAARPFNLEEPPLIRIKLFQLEAERFVFFMNMHHIVADATSISVIRNEALLLYKAYIKGELDQLQALTVQYKDFASWQNQQLSGESLKKIKNYWINRLDEADPLIPLPTDYLQVEKNDQQAAKVKIVVAKDNLVRLRKITEQNNTSLFTLTFAVFKILLNKYTGIDDLIVGTPVNGREHNELHQQVGIYLNTILVRTKIDDSLSFTDMLLQMRGDLSKDLIHQLYPYDLLLELVNEAHFNTGFTWTIRETEKEVTGLAFEIEDMPTGFGMAKNDLWLFGVEYGEILILEFAYKTSLFSRETIMLMSERLNGLIEQIIENPAKRITDLHINTTTDLVLEQQPVLIDLNF